MSTGLLSCSGITDDAGKSPEFRIGESGMKRVLKGKYEILEKIEETEKVVVCLARFVSSNRPLVVKLYKRHYSTSADRLQALTSETETLSRLTHPCLVKVFDMDFVGDIYFVAMENISGVSLFEMVENGIFVTVPQAVNIVMQLGALLTFAQREKVKARSIKLSNILITKLGQVKVLGFSKPFSETVRGIRKTRSHTTVHSDIFFMGYVLYLLITGKYPVDAQNRRVRSLANISIDTDEIRWKLDDPGGDDIARRNLDRLLLKATTRNIASRYKTVEKFLEALERHVGRYDYMINTEEADAAEESAGELDAVRDILFEAGSGNGEEPAGSSKKQVEADVRAERDSADLNQPSAEVSFESLPGASIAPREPQVRSGTGHSLIWQSDQEVRGEYFLSGIDPMWLVVIGVFLVALLGIYWKI
ncbi:MAG: hypothetical protein CVV64_00590 [Candidatus Wallbacteria bacterium HGW-Wallbacteria-1]|jgi:serine/threonine-protein kinase|uniref:non-specific serine/threonine protein kinase n=1 Tax=Candidatus Wallbacteria bacterium HGW-Wallbacteria-1 TaxID=2013854 RepID=A0A2N1PUH5_9BACT|nr:MAG: hypothetical protein CVV64_00590 [Candidatus Wallbacteria bacterium HGW-Wallbacteria-1]